MKKSTTEKSQNPEESKQTLAISSIKLQNTGPFDKLGLTINFGKKLNTKKANIHIFVGENGCGKSSVLKSLYFHKYHSPNALTTCIGDTCNIYTVFTEVCLKNEKETIKFNNWKNVFYYTPNEPNNKESEYLFDKEVSDRKIKDKLNHIWVCHYPKDDYLKYIENLENNRNALLANEYKEKDEKITTEQIKKIEIKIKLTEKLNWFIKQIYNIDFKYKYKDTNTLYQPYFNNSYFFFHQLSLGYSQIVCLITDILIKVWSVESELENPAELSFVLLLDEIDIHLHPKAQRRILPALQTLFPNAEIFCTTHSPFVVNSVSEAWKYELSEENYVNEKGEKWQKNDGMRFLNGQITNVFNDYETVLLEDFNYEDKFGAGAKDELRRLFKLINADKKNISEIKKLSDLISNSNNSSLKSRLNFELSKNNIDL